MAGKPSGAAPPHLRQGTVADTDEIPYSVAPFWEQNLSLLPPGSGTAASFHFNQCRDRAGAGRELIREQSRGSPDGSALPGSSDSATPAPSLGSESPQVASGRGGGNHCRDAAASAGKRRVPGTAPAAGRGLRRPMGPQQRDGGCVPQRSRGSPRGGGARAFRGDRSLRPPARGDPANPGLSRVTLKPPSCPTGAS